MSVEIRSRNFKMTDALKGYTGHRFGIALRGLERRVRRLTVRLADANGPKGGIDKVCRIEAELHPLGRVVIEEQQPDAYAAIDLASGRFRRVLRRSVHYAHQRRGGRESVRRPRMSAA